MRKIPTLFVRDWDGNPRYVTRQPNPECAWVFAGEGVATRKYDGVCCMFDGAAWYARRVVKPGKTAPSSFVEVARDGETGKVVGWEPVEQSAFSNYFDEALADLVGPYEIDPDEGTYELIGPRVNGNPEGKEFHELVAHQYAEKISCFVGGFDIIREQLIELKIGRGVEGIVFHHPDGRMAKIKGRDFQFGSAGGDRHPASAAIDRTSP